MKTFKHPTACVDWFPSETIKVMKHQMLNLKNAISSHFAKRHVNGNQPVRNWIEEHRRVDQASSYSLALKQLSEVDE